MLRPWWGSTATSGQTTFCTKAGVIAFAQTWSRELAMIQYPRECGRPGFIATGDGGEEDAGEVIQSMVSHTPLGRMGTPEDVAEANLWLALMRHRSFTGTVLSVDGRIVLGT